MQDTPSENLLKTIVKKLDKLIECVKELIKILGGKWKMILRLDVALW